MDIDIYFPRRMLHTSRQNANPLKYSNSYLASLAYLAIYFCPHGRRKSQHLILRVTLAIQKIETDFSPLDATLAI